MATNRCRTASIALSLFACFSSTIALAIPGQPGTLDGAWATLSTLGPGKAITPVGADDDKAYAIALQPDGKVVLVGTCRTAIDLDFCALRYNANGTVDTSFGSGGSVTTSLGTSDDWANGVAVQPDGKIVLAGLCVNGATVDFCALRYNANGTLDTSFGSGGKVITPVDTVDDYAKALILQPDGKIVLAGNCFNGTNSSFCAVRYNANGTLDASFGTAGKVITPVGTFTSAASALALQPDGKLVLAGSCSNGTNDDFCALRYNANGTPDSSFGSAGKVFAAVGTGLDDATALALQPDGKLVLSGYCYVGINADFCALRLNTNGTLDTSFGIAGKVITPVGTGNDFVQALALQPDGKLVLAGRCFNGTDDDFCALRYSANGSLDTTFGGGGKVITQVSSGNDDIANAIALQPDGKLVLAGSCGGAATIDFCAIRYDGGPFGYKACTPDLDGDGLMTATVDGLINMRVMLGMTGNAVVNGITFPPTATRNTWPLIRDYLVTQCGMSLVQ